MIIYNDFFFFGVGNVVAAVLSWNRKKNPLYALAAFVLGWLYVVYWAVSETQNYREF